MGAKGVSPTEIPGYKLRAHEGWILTTSVRYAGFPGLTTCEAFAQKTCKNRGRAKDFPSRLSYWWVLEWSMLAHAEDSDAFSLYLPHSFSVLLSSFPLYVICLWQFHLYVVYQHTLPGLIHSSFLQEDADVFLCRNRTDALIYFALSSGNFKDLRKTDTICVCVSQIL